MTKPNQSRRVEILGSLNLRDLGGYQTTDGETKWGTLFRSDSLHRLPEESQQQLIDLGIKTIIDLRSPYEIAAEKAYPLSKRAEINYFNFPLMGENQGNIIETIKSQSLLELYALLLEERSSTIKTIIETVATQPTPTVIHCAIGKDRTGLISALILAVAGVEVATIAQDYNLSDLYLASMYDELRVQAEAEYFTHLLSSPVETMLDTFGYLDSNYGGVANYLQQIGIDKHMQNTVAEVLVSP